MTHTTTIVVGVDGAWRRTGAVDWALDQALRSGARLHLVHVVDDRYAQWATLDNETVAGGAQALMDAVDGRVREQDTTAVVTADAVAGTPGIVLAEAARSALLLVVGRRGVGAFDRLLIGSTSENAVNHADVPVVVVPDGWNPAEHAEGPVVAGVDVMRTSYAALEFAFAAAAHRSVPLRLVHLWNLPAGYVWDASYVGDELGVGEARSRAMFDELVGTWVDKHPDVVVEPVLRQGHPVEGLVGDAARSEAQLVVVGGRRHSRITGLVLGSVARGVLHHATCPLAIVHDVERSAGERPGRDQLDSPV